MKEIDHQKVRKVMRRLKSEHIDECGEVNCTGLAEAVCEELDLYEDDDDYTIPEELFDIAVEVSEEMDG